MQAPPVPLRLGTRRSTLAMSQSQLIADEITRRTGRAVELVEITTYGDTSREALAQIGGTGVFVNALREALLDGKIDLAVHSLKDLPTAPPEGLALAAVPPREDPRDALVARDGLGLAALVEECRAAGRPARVGTGSPRRMAQLAAWARDRGAPLELVPIRGNVDTRIGFVTSGELDGVILATAGLRRIGRHTEATELLDPDLLLPAPGQGALALECAAGNGELRARLGELDDPATRAAVTAERALLAALEAGCSAPVGALAVPAPSSAEDTAPDAVSDDSNDSPARGNVSELRLRAVVGTVDGGSQVQLSATGSTADAAALGRSLAAELLARGAAGLMGERVL
ncbi:hydroxymethylbilane synthase [Mangrovactinospora gilvigrisea]|uniref:Porphobilinogen deaminase n=1 Tax=Mangrovactinospora gilvigrisea TaxID=1428644 RepID=A0A1J7BCF8_9ACTN|nr:hydroxymethylbilane synthase [Mangrovactinospora gilvigrisea]OIV36383.1 hydroxymethylbilane synthase [Mangrovactinospora gilvigrisea]